MNEVFSNLVIMARTGNTFEAAQAYAILMDLPIQECKQTMESIRKVLTSVKNVRITNKDEQSDIDQEELPE